MTIKANSITTITLGRIGSTDYQVSYWSDGVARFDGNTGQRQGAWDAHVPPSWFARAAKLARNLTSGLRPSEQTAATVVLDTTEGRLVYEAQEADEPADFWVLSTLLDGMSGRTPWSPLDLTGDQDFARYDKGTPVWLSIAGTAATGLALGGNVLVLAGARACMATYPSLEGAYQRARTKLLDAGELAIEGDHLRLVRHTLFSSPSSAASVLAGSNNNGRRAWRDVAGSAWSELDLD
jgi:hypothetical protein